MTPTVLYLGLREAEAILAGAAPEMAVFAAWAVQGRRDARALDIATRSLARASTIMDGTLRRSVEEGILSVLHPTVVGKGKRTPMIDISQLPKNPAVEKWKAELRAEGRVEGRAEGRAEGAARLLLRVLRQRGFTVSSEIEARVLATLDTGRIEAWTDRALVASTLDEVFVEG